MHHDKFYDDLKKNVHHRIIKDQNSSLTEEFKHVHELNEKSKAVRDRLWRSHDEIGINLMRVQQDAEDFLEELVQPTCTNECQDVSALVHDGNAELAEPVVTDVPVEPAETIVTDVPDAPAEPVVPAETVMPIDSGASFMGASTLSTKTQKRHIIATIVNARDQLLRANKHALLDAELVDALKQARARLEASIEWLSKNEMLDLAAALDTHTTQTRKDRVRQIIVKRISQILHE